MRRPGPGAQRPERAPRQGAKVRNRISGESEPPVRRAGESMSVRHVLSTQRRTFREAVCEERAGQPLAPGHRDKPVASSYQRDIHVKQGGDVKRAGASARTSEHDRTSAHYGGAVAVDRRPRWTLRAPSAHYLLLRDRLTSFLPHEIHILQTLPGKNDLRIRIPAAFLGSGWGKIRGKNRHDLRTFGGGYTRCNSAVFWQTGL
jgi:hypothetical protein